MILLRGVQIVHFGSLSGDEWDIVIAAEARIHAWRRRCINLRPGRPPARPWSELSAVWRAPDNSAPSCRSERNRPIVISICCGRISRCSARSVPGAWHKSTAPARRVGIASGRSPEGMNRSERAWPYSDSDSAPASSTENAQALPPAGRSARAGRHGSAHSPRRPAATGRERLTHFPQLGELLPAEHAQQFELLGGVRAWLRGVENE